MINDVVLPVNPDPVGRSTKTTRGARVYGDVLEVLRQRIRQGEWLPNQRLPSIPQLAKELGVGSGSVREALRSLQSVGLVKIEHGSGVYVTGTPARTELADQFQKMDTGLILALAETRCILEPELAAFAAERGSAEELAAIEKLAEQMAEDARQGQDFVKPDVEFHRCIALAAHNPVLYRMMEGVNDVFLESRKLTAREAGMTARAVRYHLLIAEALRLRDASQARRLMLAHMNDSLTAVLMVEANPSVTD
jgi:GntR family transcriptional regulator, transcriptional repressor for pyruvate dehydrogenase complex